MTDDKTQAGDTSTGDKTLSVPSTQKTLTLNKQPSGNMVRQNFTHGRSKSVVVEVHKKRRIGPDGKPLPERPVTSVVTPAPTVAMPPKPVAPARPQPSGRAPSPSSSQHRTSAPQKSGGMVLRELSDAEKQLRAQVLVEARGREAEDRRQVQEEAARREALDVAMRKEREEAEARKREEEDRRRFEEEAKRVAESEASRRLSGGEPAPRSAAPVNRAPSARPAPSAAAPARPVLPPTSRAIDPTGAPVAPTKSAFAPTRPRADDEDDARGGKKMARPAPVKTEKREADRRPGRVNVTAALSDEDERSRSMASMRRRVQRHQRRAMGDQPREKITREVVIPEAITIQELANRMSERGVDVIRLLMKQGELHKITDVIDADTAQLIAEEMGHTVKRVAESDIEDGLFNISDHDDHLEARPPVVTIMGHVDHGKTSLLDAIRKTNVVSGEAGGITQHIGAYQVKSPLGGKITFIDTPGHAAFTAMRARGAKVTDIVVLVVAADDGVMPQTIEAISHAKAAKVPLIIAINKIDKPGAKPERIRAELLQYDVQVESMGGDTLEVEVSAKQRTNLDKLLEGIQLQSEVLDLKANPNRPAEAIVVEAKLDKGRGAVATAIVQRGTLRVGDIVVAGSAYGKVRALIGDSGTPISEAGPSMPVEILGFAGVPEAGDRLAVVENEARAREVAAYRDRQRREKAQARLAGARTSLADMMTQIKAGQGRKEFVLIVKGDVQGSVEAIQGALDKLGTDEVGARIIHSGAGGVTESDVTLANASNAVIIGFNVRANREAREAAERDGIEIRYYNIIYDLVDDVKAAMGGMLAPIYREEMLGNALIQEVFNVSKMGKIAGCRVTDGKVERGAGVRLIRDNVVIHEGRLSTLKRFKDDAKEVTAGMECGMSFENYQDMRQGDIIECYRVVMEKRTL